MSITSPLTTKQYATRYLVHLTEKGLYNTGTLNWKDFLKTIVLKGRDTGSRQAKNDFNGKEKYWFFKTPSIKLARYDSVEGNNFAFFALSACLTVGRCHQKSPSPLRLLLHPHQSSIIGEQIYR